MAKIDDQIAELEHRIREVGFMAELEQHPARKLKLQRKQATLTKLLAAKREQKVRADARTLPKRSGDYKRMAKLADKVNAKRRRAEGG